MFNLWDERKLFVIQRLGYREGMVVEVIVERISNSSDFAILYPYSIITEYEELKFSSRDELIKDLQEKDEMSNKLFYKLIGKNGEYAVIAIDSKACLPYEVPFLIPLEFRKGLLQIEETDNPYPYD